jgi:predicted dehydrogenase
MVGLGRRFDPNFLKIRQLVVEERLAIRTLKDHFA